MLDWHRDADTADWTAVLGQNERAAQPTPNTKNSCTQAKQ